MPKAQRRKAAAVKKGAVKKGVAKTLKKKAAKPTKAVAPKRRPAAKAPQAPTKRTPAEQAFVSGLVSRGEAVKLGKGEALPPGATHEIVGVDEANRPIVKRRRFSLT